jgi:hypothetical protein
MMANLNFVHSFRFLYDTEVGFYLFRYGERIYEQFGGIFWGIFLVGRRKMFNNLKIGEFEDLKINQITNNPITPQPRPITNDSSRSADSGRSCLIG